MAISKETEFLSSEVLSRTCSRELKSYNRALSSSRKTPLLEATRKQERILAILQ